MTHKIYVLISVIFGTLGLPNIEANEQTYQNLEAFAQANHYLESMYVDEKHVDPNALLENALLGLTKSLDKHTKILTKKDYKQLTRDTEGSFVGIGISIQIKQQKLFVGRVFEGTPASQKLLIGDEIIKINDILVTNTNLTTALDLLQGLPDTEVHLKILRKTEEKAFSLVRKKLEIPSVHYIALPYNTHYISIDTFQEKTTLQLQALLQKLSPNSKVIIDLRDNPGGLLNQAVSVSDLFIDSGLIVSTKGRTQNSFEREFAHLQGTYSSLKLVVLINGNSASASEIVAGALQDHKRALILGRKSYGKGSVQTLIPLANGMGLKMTIAKYYTPKNKSIQSIGIQPDVILDPQNTSPKELEKYLIAQLNVPLETISNSKKVLKENLTKDLDIFGAFLALNNNTTPYEKQ
jgi:carboxyl-terminal processing protease